MTTAALLPIKPIAQSKTRLSTVMTAEARMTWVRDEINHTLSVMKQVTALSDILVISADPEVWQMAKSHRVKILQEPDVPGLNQSIQRGLAWCHAEGHDCAIVLPIDLPLLKPYCVRSALARLIIRPGVVVVPDRHERGTNLLLWSPLDLITPAFGEDSFEKHCQAARAAGVEPIIYRCADLAIDIDSPDDLALVMV